jgi:hypothetical protein
MSATVAKYPESTTDPSCSRASSAVRLIEKVARSAAVPTSPTPLPSGRSQGLSKTTFHASVRPLMVM